MTGLTTPLDQAQYRPQGTSRGCLPQPGPPCSPALQPDPFPFPDDCNSLLTGPWPWLPSTHHPPTMEFPRPDSLPMASTVELLPLKGSFNASPPCLHSLSAPHFPLQARQRSPLYPPNPSEFSAQAIILMCQHSTSAQGITGAATWKTSRMRIRSPGFKSEP